MARIVGSEFAYGIILSAVCEPGVDRGDIVQSVEGKCLFVNGIAEAVLRQICTFTNLFHHPSALVVYEGFLQFRVFTPLQEAGFQAVIVTVSLGDCLCWEITTQCHMTLGFTALVVISQCGNKRLPSTFIIRGDMAHLPQIVIVERGKDLALSSALESGQVVISVRARHPVVVDAG